MRRSALLSALLLLLRCSVSRGSYTEADYFASGSFVQRASAADRDAFWKAALATAAVELDDDSSLPPLGGAADTFRSVAVCITGGARGFPDRQTGIFDSIKKHLVDALGANQTDIYYIMELNDAGDALGKGGSFNWSIADFAEAFAVLPPFRAVFITARPRPDCKNACYAQYLKLDQCLDMIRQTEYEEGMHYDFVIRQRPDFHLDASYRNIFTLKRAAYATHWHGGIDDEQYFAHRDFADAAFGMTRVLAFGETPCGMHGHLTQFMRQSKVCGGQVNCECWPKTSLRLGNATVVTGRQTFSAHVMRMGPG